MNQQTVNQLKKATQGVSFQGRLGVCFFLFISSIFITSPAFAADSSSGASFTSTSSGTTESSGPSVFGDYDPLKDNFGKEEEKYTDQRSGGADVAVLGDKNKHYRSPYSTERGFRQSAKARLAKFKSENKEQPAEESLKMGVQ